MENELSYEFIGQVAVDTGTIIIADPCNAKDITVDTIIEAEEKGSTGQIGEFAGVFTSTGLGDGIYDVYALHTETPFGKRVAEVHIVFLYDEEEETEE